MEKNKEKELRNKLLECIHSESLLGLATEKKLLGWAEKVQKQPSLQRMSSVKLAWFFGYVAGVLGGPDGWLPSKKMLDKAIK
jgi:hypothetical protein